MGFFLRLFFYGLFVSGAGIFTSRLIEFMDIYKVVHSNVPGPCSFVKGVESGAEDIAVLPSGIAIMSTGAQISSESKSKPAVLMFNFKSPSLPAKEMKLSGFKGQLNPHGISLYTEGGQTFLYLVNHPPKLQVPGADTIERFLVNVDKETLIHEKTFTDPEFLFLNDLVVVGKDKFYASNFFTMQSKILREMESFLMFILPIQNVVYYDGKNATVVLSGRYAANGINVSPDKKFLYLAEFSRKQISSYRIESPSKLVPVDTRSLGSMPDNLDVNPENGDVWIGLHPSGISFFKFFFGWAVNTPSQAVRVGVKDGKFTGSTEIYSDDGKVLSGVSVAVPFEGAVLLGTMSHKALYCKLSSFNAALKL